MGPHCNPHVPSAVFTLAFPLLKPRPKIPPFSLALLARYGKRNKSLIGNHAMSETRSHLYNQQEVNAIVAEKLEPLLDFGAWGGASSSVSLNRINRPSNLITIRHLGPFFVGCVKYLSLAPKSADPILARLLRRPLS